MKFKVIVLCIVLGVGLLAGCVEKADNKPGATDMSDGYDVICLNEVQYYQAGWSLAPKYSARSNTPDICS